jgi:hypothetical protein
MKVVPLVDEVTEEVGDRLGTLAPVPARQLRHQPFEVDRQVCEGVLQPVLPPDVR